MKRCSFQLLVNVAGNVKILLAPRYGRRLKGRRGREGVRKNVAELLFAILDVRDGSRKGGGGGEAERRRQTMERGLREEEEGRGGDVNV